MRIGNKYFDSLDTVYQRKLIGWPTEKIQGRKKRWEELHQRSLAARSQPKRGNYVPARYDLRAHMAQEATAK